MAKAHSHLRIEERNSGGVGNWTSLRWWGITLRLSGRLSRAVLLPLN